MMAQTLVTISHLKQIICCLALNLTLLLHAGFAQHMQALSIGAESQHVAGNSLGIAASTIESESGRVIATPKVNSSVPRKSAARAAAILPEAISQPTAVISQTASATITTNPEGLQIIVDGTTYTAPETFDWTANSTHTIAVASPQSGGTGIQYIFSSWSDNGPQSHTITVPGSGATYTANFTKQYQLTVSSNPADGGSTSPAGSDWYDSGQLVPITAIPNSGYSFSNWTGGALGVNNPVLVQMIAPISVVAHFSSTNPNPAITITTRPAGKQVIVDGTTYIAPKTFNWTPNSSHTIGVASPQSGTSGTRYAFGSWSDNGAQTHSITVPSGNATYTANFTTQHQLTITSSPSDGGSTSPSGTNWYESGQSVAVTAAPNSGYSFSGWSGNALGNDNPVQVQMIAPKSVVANFAAITPDPDITIATDPVGKQIIVDGATYTAPKTFTWAPNSSHTIGIASPQSGGTGTQYVFNSWSDTGAQSHAITVPAGNTTYTAKFTTQYQLTVTSNPGSGGSTSPSGTAWYNSGQSVSVTATAGNGYIFSGWSGAVSGGSNPVQVSMNMPRAVGASFVIDYPATVPVKTQYNFPSYQNLSDFKGTDYQIIGFPGASNLPLASVLAGEHITDWQAYWDSGDANNPFVEFDGSDIFKLTAGRAFWIIARGAIDMNFTASTPSLNASLQLEIPLHAGWNLITNPFAAAKTWAVVQKANNITDQLYSYNSGFSIAAIFEANRGYYFFNSKNLQVLKVPFITTSSNVQKAAFSEQWRIGVNLRTSTASDEIASFGISSEAKAGLDNLDARRPRAIGDQPNVYFYRPEWDERYPYFATDIRPNVGGYASWEFKTQNIAWQENVLSFSGIETLPEEFGIYLLDHTQLQNHNLRQNSEIASIPKTGTSEYSIIVGRPESIAEKVKTVTPSEFDLSSNYPNPFNAGTAFKLDIPVTSEVAFAIFDALGKKVKTLFYGPLKPGRHWFRWDGRNEYGESLASGIYFYQLTANSKIHHSGKMLFIK